MKNKNLDSWKSAMKRIAKERNLDVQDVQQRFVLEEFARKLKFLNIKKALFLKEDS